MYCILGRQALEWEIYGMDANLRENTTIYIKVLRIGYADAGRGNLPSLLCPLQNAGSTNLNKPEQHILVNRTLDEGTGPVSLFQFPECKNL